MKFKIAGFAFLMVAATPVWAATQTVKLSVPDMSCPACPITVKKALSRVSGVEKIIVSLEKHEAVVTYDDNKADISKLTEATELAGYPSTVKK